MGVGHDGRVLLRCHAGCTFDSICAALGIEKKDLFEAGEPRQPSQVYPSDNAAVAAVLRMVQAARGRGWRLVSSSPYLGATGIEVMRVLRFEAPDGSEKTFRPIHPLDRGWALGDPPGPLPLYHLPEIAPASRVYVCEGEKATDAAVRLGLTATTNAHGASASRRTDWSPLASKEVVLLPDHDEPGEKWAREITDILLPMGSTVRIVKLPDLPERGDIVEFRKVRRAAGIGDDEIRREIGTLVQRATPSSATREETVNGRQQPRSELIVIRLSDVEPEEVRWLWDPYLPLGKITILEGDPGVGKTWLALNLAAIVTRGHPFPSATDGVPRERREPANVVYMTAEDGLADTLRPRLDRAGADASRVFAITAVCSTDPETGKQSEEPFTFDNLKELERVLMERAPSLVVVDPLQAYLGAGIDAHRANETRPVLAACARLAERHGCAFLLIRHLGKAPSGRAIYRGLGSIDFAAAARSVLLVGKDPNNPERRAVVHVKSSLAPMGPSIGFKLEQGELSWTGRSNLTAGDLLACDPSPQEKSALEEACDFLKKELAKGSRPFREVKEAAEDASVSLGTLKRAKKKLGVTPTKVGRPGEPSHWEWAFPPKESSGDPEWDQRNSEGDQEDHVDPDDPLRESLIPFGSNGSPKPREADPGRSGDCGGFSPASSLERDPYAALEREAIKAESVQDRRESSGKLRDAGIAGDH